MKSVSGRMAVCLVQVGDRSNSDVGCVVTIFTGLASEALDVKNGLESIGIPAHIVPSEATAPSPSEFYFAQIPALDVQVPESRAEEALSRLYPPEC